MNFRGQRIYPQKRDGVNSSQLSFNAESQVAGAGSGVEDQQDQMGQRAPLHGRSNYASSRRLGDVQSRPKKSGQRTESPREAGEPRRKARWWTEAPIPPPVLRTARTPSPGGRKPPGRHTTPRPPTCLQRHRLCVTARRVVASRQDATGAGPPTSSYLLATPQALRNSARCAATGQPETGLDNKP